MLEDVRSGFDLDVRPQDDLFGHVNGRWIRETEIPEDLPRWGVSMARRQEVEAQVLAIVEEAASTDQEAAAADGEAIPRLWPARPAPASRPIRCASGGSARICAQGAGWPGRAGDPGYTGRLEEARRVAIRID